MNYDNIPKSRRILGNAAIVQKPPFLNPIINGKACDGQDNHFWEDGGIETTIHDSLAQKLVP